MVLMMESQCEYFMYFPAVPISDLSDPARYRSLPRRSHLYLGETVRFLLVLRSQNGASGLTGSGGGDNTAGSEHPNSRAWRDLANSLCAVASVCPGDSRQRSQMYHDYHSSGDEGMEDADEDELADGCRGGSKKLGFRECKPLLIHNSPGNGMREFRKAPLQVIKHCFFYPLLENKNSLYAFTLHPVGGQTPC